MDAKIRFSFLGDHSASVWGIDVRRKGGEGNTPGEDCCIFRGRNDNGSLDQHGGNGRKEVDTFWK